MEKSMSKSITQHFIVIRILIILGLLSQQVLIPLELFASTAQPSSSLVRGFTEDVDTYLQRVAATQPDLFQQAALAAVQDAFNGKLPEISGDRAMEEQIAYYLQQAAENPTQAIGSAPATSSSLAKDGTYRWNSSAEDKSGQAPRCHNRSEHGCSVSAACQPATAVGSRHGQSCAIITAHAAQPVAITGCYGQR